MKTEDLIVQLAADTTPVPRLSTTSVRLVAWLVVALPVVALFVAAVGPRPDLITRISTPAFLASFVSIACLALVSAVAALVSSVPGHQRSRVLTVMPLFLAASWATALALRLLAGGAIGEQLASEPLHAACTLQISTMALFPAIVLLRSVNLGAPLSPASSGVLAVAAAFAAGAAGSAIICPIDRPAHEMLWHLLPMAGFAAAGVFVGRAWLDRMSS